MRPQTILRGVRFRFRHGGRVIGGVAFGAGDDFLAAPGVTVDLAYRLSENEWNGTTTVDIKIVDARPAAGWLTSLLRSRHRMRVMERRIPMKTGSETIRAQF